MICWALAAAFSLYIGSYFLCVSQARCGFTGTSQVSIVPVYRYVPNRFDAPMFYQHIHLLDRKYLRASAWQDRPAHEGELNGIVGLGRVLFKIPITNTP